MRDNNHYAAIKAFYDGRTAVRSGVPLIRHVDEGLLVLDHLGATRRAKEAFCIHPLLQADDALARSLEPDSVLQRYSMEPSAIVLAMEYRRVANAYLSHHCVGESDAIELSHVPEVNDMLIADKVQNRKDFEHHHLGRHERSDALVVYFRNWLRALRVSEDSYTELAALLSQQNGGPG